MDLETENRIAAILLKEAAEIRRQAEKEGVHAYLRAPQVRGRPNSRFLTATVMGVQQANRTVEVNEMWNIRQKELELDKRINNNNNKRTRDERSRHYETSRSAKNVHNTNGNTASCSTSKRVIEDYSTKEEEEDDRCLKDEEIEEFLHSRTKRGRGAVGSRMDEPGPYLPKQHLSRSHDWEAIEEPDRRALVGPKKPVFLKGRSRESSSSEDEESGDRSKRRKEKKVHSKKSKHKSRRDKKDKERKDKKKEKKKHKEYYK
ncbi:pre-mRNA-splicing factor 38B [Impatiens glandulifera]|uniref:pre-mRNA-splicing factor 38B n=1 Tax=Impatiens glandulifera TaxID=253017 RepID=UPI001FB16387|nr:pre-mRNA-splicing factor 38B [Impatiens glandulifera]XP_047306959.1 pre-mRNA-splicing factor 38B [Impatiens glandulifera]